MIINNDVKIKIAYLMRARKNFYLKKKKLEKYNRKKIENIKKKNATIIILKFIKLWYFKWRLHKSVKKIQSFIRGSITRSNNIEFKNIRIKLNKLKHERIEKARNIISKFIKLWYFKWCLHKLYINKSLFPKKILIVQMTCKKNKHLWNKLLNRVSNSIIFYGNPNLKHPYLFKDRVLQVKCQDTYDYLPDKVLLMIKAVLKIVYFNNITHILKIDDHDTSINNKVFNILNSIKLYDYCGQQVSRPTDNIHYNSQFRKYHYGKCPKKSYWDNKIYRGNFCHYCLGGSGYLLSRKSMNILSKTYSSKIYKTYIYEDVMIALFLKKKNIYPNKIKKIILDEFDLKKYKY